MRNALNNLQSTAAGFGMVTSEHVYKVCDQPHPLKVAALLQSCLAGNTAQAVQGMTELWGLGFSALDIVQTLFKVAKAIEAPESTRLDMIQAISAAHMRVADGAATYLQMIGLVGKLTNVVRESRAAGVR